MQVNATATEMARSFHDRPWYAGADEAGWGFTGLAINRDSDPLDRSNYRVGAQILRDAGAEVSPSSFNHWAVGWVEYLDVRLSLAAVKAVEEIRARLETYPVLDDDDFSQTEWDDDHPDDGRCYSRHLEEYGEECPCGLPRA